MRLLLRQIPRDLAAERGRAFFALLSVFFGAASLGVLLFSQGVFLREREANYLATNPSSFILSMPGGVPAEAMVIVQADSDVSTAIARGRWSGRFRIAADGVGVSTNDEGVADGSAVWGRLDLTVLENFGETGTDLIFPETGTWPPQAGSILIERQSLGVYDIPEDAMLAFRVPGITMESRYSGTVWAPGFAQAMMERLLYGFIAASDVPTPTRGLNEIAAVVSGDRRDAEAIRRTASRIALLLEERGYPVDGITVPPPLQHPHQSQIRAILALQGILGVLVLALASILSAAVFASILGSRTRRIGTLKALGASPGSVMISTFGLVALVSVAGLALAVPVSFLFGRLLAGLFGSVFNTKIFDASVPAFDLVALLGAGLAVPLLAASVPLIRTGRVTVREALADYGIRTSSAPKTSARRERSAASLRPGLTYALKNAFRKKGRMILAVGTLVVGGVLFIAAVDVAASLRDSVTRSVDREAYDVAYVLGSDTEAARLDALFGSVEGLADWEAQGYLRAPILSDAREAANAANVCGVLPDSRLVNLEIIEGRNLTPSDDGSGVAVVNTILASNAGVGIGDTIRVATFRGDLAFTIVGINRQVAGTDTAYVPYSTLYSLLGREGSYRRILVRAVNRTDAPIVSAGIEDAMMRDGVALASSTSLAEFRDAFLEHLVLILGFLSFLAVLAVVVGGIGTASVLAMNVMERRREFGVLRAVGATNRTLLGTVLGEAWGMAMTAWTISVALAWPLSKALTDRMGMIMIQTPLDLSFSPVAIVAWLLLVLVTGSVAAIAPASRVLRLPVREALAFE